MAQIKFNLHQPYTQPYSEVKKRKEAGRKIPFNPTPTRIYLVLIMDAKHRLKVKTDHKILASNWNFKANRPKAQSGDYHIKPYLDALETKVEKQFRELEKDEATWVKVKEQIKDLVLNKTSKIKKSEKENLTLLQVYDLFIKSKSIDLSERTIKKFRTLENELTAFQDKTQSILYLDDIDMNFYDAFRKHLLTTGRNKYTDKPGRSNETVSKFFANLKNFMRWSRERGHHNNDVYTFRDFSAKRKPRNEIVTLTKEEVLKLHAVDVSHNERLQRVKDLGIFFIHTLQRWDDVHSIRKQDIIQDKKQWSFIAKKTGKRTTILFKGYFAKAWDILEKYDFQLPTITEQEFNRTFKKLGKLAGINSTVEFNREQGNQTITVSGEKWEFMSSHMGRRTGTSLLANDGFPLTLLQEITKHEDIKTLMKYVDDNTKQKQLDEAIEKHTLELFPEMRIAR